MSKSKTINGKTITGCGIILTCPALVANESANGFVSEANIFLLTKNNNTIKNFLNINLI